MTNPVGRPFKFKTAKELQSAIDEYFDYCDNRIKEIHTKEGEAVAITVPAPYTMSGLANRLGIDRDTLINYSHNDNYSALVKAARNRVHEDVERRLMETTNQSGAIFNLKNNFGWRDKTEQDITSDGKALPILVQFVGENDNADATSNTDTDRV